MKQGRPDPSVRSAQPSLTGFEVCERTAMRHPSMFSVALLIGVLATTRAIALDTVYTDTRKKCSTIGSESEGRIWRCKGPAGYSAVFSDEGNVVEVQFGKTGGERNLGQLQWPGAGEAIGPRVEWRLKAGKPVAAILRIIKRDKSGRSHPHLLVAKITVEGGCLIETIDARSRGANAKARSIADQRAPTHRCSQ